MLCAAIMSDHWEEVGWNREMLDQVDVNPTWYLDGKVAMLEPLPGHASFLHHFQKKPAFLVPMHGGIWTLCVSLTGKIKQIFFGAFNYKLYLS